MIYFNIVLTISFDLQKLNTAYWRLHGSMFETIYTN